MVRLKGIKRDMILKINAMSYEDKKKVIDKMPVKALCYLYTQMCSKDQVTDLFCEWEKFSVMGESDEVKKRSVEKIRGLVKSLRRNKKVHMIPREIYLKYV